MSNKSSFLIASLGILTLIVTVMGASFAYFNIQTNADYERTYVDVNSANPSGVVTFNTITDFLSFEIADEEMSTENVGKKYYATNNLNKKFALETEEHVFKLAEAKVNGGETKYKCYYDFTIILDESSNMNAETRGEIVMNFGGDSVITTDTTIDLLDLIQNKKMHLKGYFNELEPVKYNNDGTVDGVKAITIEMYVLNTNREQAPYVANTGLNVRIEPTYISEVENMFKCEEIHN